MVPRSSFFEAQSILSPLPREYVARLLARASAKVLAKGQTLFEIGSAGDGCFLLDEGVVKVSMASKQGTERTLAILASGSIVGELAMIDGLPRSATVQALRDSRLTFLPRSIFVECLRDHPEIYVQLVTILVARLRQADEEVAESSFLTLEARVARALLQFTKYLGEPGAEDRVVIRDKIRQADLAALADVARVFSVIQTRLDTLPSLSLGRNGREKVGGSDAD